MDPYRGLLSGERYGKWPIAVNPDDISSVYFRDPADRRWHALAWEHAPGREMPVSEEALEFARRLAAARDRFHRLGTTTGDVLTSVGLLHRGPSGPVDSGILGRLVTLLDADQAAALAWTAGATQAQVHAMTLARYDRRVHVVDPQRRRVEARYVWGQARGSRYCPACLAESGGRWLLSWRLGWSFACLDHHLLLVDACPRCRRTPRHFPATTRHALGPGSCHSPAEGDPQRARCGQPFEEVPAVELTARGATIEAQELIEKAISSGQADFGVHQDNPQPSLALFGDLRALASILLRRVPERLTGFVPPEILALHQQPLPQRRGPSTPPRSPARAVWPHSGPRRSPSPSARPCTSSSKAMPTGPEPPFAT
ncbi:TniQ family protein [Streptomyces sp. NPDC058240]|uniref:TniQ family protein n=1 Tax=Streptomyces sp. NPDC058240 TaxID=3346396 RepID=UPI0036E42BDD